MKILFVVPYPEGEAPSQRFRFEQYYHFLTHVKWTYKTASFLDEKTWKVLYKPGHLLTKILGIIWGFTKRFFLLFSVPLYDYIFIHREATPVGPPWFEWVVVKVFRKKLIYDFDDAIWIGNTSENNKIVSGFKWHQKVASICSWAYKVSCGNSYLQAYAKQFNHSAVVNPTTIDTLNLHNKVKLQDNDEVVIGWTGTHSTMKYLDQIIPVIQRLELKYEFKFCVISNKPLDVPLRSLIYKPWNKSTEITDLLLFNIGVMPLEDDPWAKGKCAFKALQYMALGIPAVVSPVGMNIEVVDNGVNGFVCSTEDEWFECLDLLLQNAGLRESLGRAARKKIESTYAVAANRDNFLGLFS